MTAEADSTGAFPTLAAGVRANPAVAGITFAYLAGFGVYGVVERRPATIAYLVMVGALMLLVARLNEEVRFSLLVLWGLTTWGLLHLAGGLIPVGDGVLYNADLHLPALHYDRLVHAFGFGVATVACWQALRGQLAPGASAVTAAVVAGLAGLGLGGLNEVVEFGATNLLNATNVGGYSNTGWDLVFDVIGCAVAATGIRRQAGRA
jgi:hypothetical protein